MANKPIDFRTKKVTLDTKTVFDAIDAKNKNPYDKMNASKLARLMRIHNQTISEYKNKEIAIGMKVLVQLVHMSGLRLEEFIIIKDRPKLSIQKKKKDE